MAKIHCHSLLSGSSWSSYGEDSTTEEAEAMEVDENNGLGTVEATRLHRKDMTLFGICPDQEEIVLVVCKECGRVVKAEAFLRHCELNHQKIIPVPTPSPPEMVAKSTTVVEALLKATPRKRKFLDSVITNQKIELMDATVKIEEMPLAVPCLNHSHPASVVKTESLDNNVLSKKSSTEKASSNKKSPRKQIPTREREFDADKHCGVWVAELQKQCTRSLTCKTHALSLRRAVVGRRKPFDELLAEHKARVNCEKEQQQNSALKLQEQAAQKTLDVTLKRSLSASDASVISSANSSRSNIGRSVSVEEESLHVNGVVKTSSGSDITEDGTSVNEMMTLNRHPKPMTSCHFGSRSVGRGCFVFNRRSDHLRCAVLSMVERCLNPSLPRLKSNRASAAILQRPAMKTVGQSSNQGSSSVLERYKSNCNRSMNNFLKAPPPPRNKTLKQVNSGHPVNHVENVLNNSKSAILQGTSLPNKRTYLDSIGTNSNGLTSSAYVKPDASSQAISDMGNIVANIETNVSGGHPLNLGHPLGVAVTKGSIVPGPSLSVSGGGNLDSSLNLCSTLGINSNSGNVQGSIATTQTSFVAGNTSSMMTVASGTQISGVTTVTGQIQPGFSNIKEILPAPVQGKVAVGSVVSTSSSSPLFKGVQITAQVDPSTGKVASTSAGLRASPVFFKQGTGTVQVSSMPNGTGPSPPPPGGTVKGFPLNFVIKGNTATQATTTSAAGGTASVANPTNLNKGQNVIFNNMGISQLQRQSQLIVQQPPSSMSPNVHQRGKAGNARTGTVHKGMQKAPSPSSQGQVVQTLSPQQANATQQQKTVVVTSPQGNQSKLFINHNNITSSQQPIAQLKQQVAQQQQQLQQMTFQKQIQQQQHQQQQQHIQQQKQTMSSQFIKQLPIQPRIAPAPPTQSVISQHSLTGQNVLVKVSEQLKSPPNAVFVKTEPQQKIQHIVCQKPQSNVV